MKGVEIFCSYDHEDEPLWRELEKQLHFLARHGLISTWHYHALQAGQEWQREVEQHLHKAHLILLLISPDFMASDQCYLVEMQEAMKRHETGEARVIPIILRPVHWEDEPFSKLYVLPTGGKPAKSWSDSDEAFLDIARGIGKVVNELLNEQFRIETEQLYKNGQLEEVLIACEQAIYLGLDPATAYWRRGNVLLSWDKYEEALAAYQEALHYAPTLANPYFYQNQGHALRYLKRYEEALAAYQRALDLSLPDPDPRLYYDKADVLKLLAEQAYEIANKIAKQRHQGASDGTLSN